MPRNPHVMQCTLFPFIYPDMFCKNPDRFCCHPPSTLMSQNSICKSRFKCPTCHHILCSVKCCMFFPCCEEQRNPSDFHCFSKFHLCKEVGCGAWCPHDLDAEWMRAPVPERRRGPPDRPCRYQPVAVFWWWLCSKVSVFVSRLTLPSGNVKRSIIYTVSVKSRIWDDSFCMDFVNPSWYVL